MKVSESPACVLTAVKLDGSQGSGVRKSCGVCRRAKVLFIASPGLRALVPGLPEREETCVNSDGPCVMALRAKKWLDGLRVATR